MNPGSPKTRRRALAESLSEARCGDAGGKADGADLARMLYVAAQTSARTWLGRDLYTFRNEGARAEARRMALNAVRRLLKLGADVDERPKFSYYDGGARVAWIEAAAYGDLELLRLALPTSKLARTASLTDVARANHNEHIVRELLRRGFPPPDGPKPKRL